MIELTPRIYQRLFVFIMLVILAAELHALPSPDSSDSTVETSSENFEKSHNSHPLGILKSLANEGHRHKRQECQSDRECQSDQEWCWGNICEDPCYRLDCQNEESPTGRCVVINHQPRCLEY
ncbi:uncharacterized protein LOC111049531 isoform X1 [Nilaparvata lugens]|uniref:uncharacterized protein LOC111049531 isoform X1 n=1 Tax=Nilaparvata lugens TaxID=108931 RepID=UPI00193D8FD8|nr:uncharacterized protein LOC111049531 isoform X1 [Nilaparvata lugens]